MVHASSGRIRFLSSFFILVAFFIVVRLGYLQIVHGEAYSESANRQYAVPQSNIFERGSIFFKERDGNLISGATLKSGFFVAMNPEKITVPEATYTALATIIPLEHDSFITRATREGDPYEEIARRLNEEEAKKIEALGLEGIDIYREKWRFYPGGSLAAQALGFVAYDEDTLSGRYGLERQYEDVLSRQGSGLYLNFFAEVFSNLRENLFQDVFKREGDIIITIDPQIQGELEKELHKVSEQYLPSLTGGIIMDPKDGRIFALGLSPTFDVNKFQEEKSQKVFSNPLVESVYEMGSIIKPLMMAAGLDSGVITAKTTYQDNGSVVLSNYTIYNFDKKGRGRVDMQEVLNNSLNTGMVFVSQKLGHDRVRDYFLNYGFGEKSGVDLPNETNGLITNLFVDRDLEYANASFGQGIAVNPIVAIRALASLGNGGYLVTPHVVSEIDLKGGLKEKIEYPISEAVIQKETSEEITRMLVNVVDKALLGGTVKMEHYSIAAKTGTAQLARPDGKGYYDDRYLHSFFGYFPAYDPQFIILLFTVDPKGERYASQTLTHPFIDLARFLISYYEVPPDR